MKSPLIADMAAESRPREKALREGIKSLSDAELMAIIFGTGIKGKSVVELCHEILDSEKGHLSKVAALGPREFMKRFKGIGPAKALTLMAALELGARSAADALTVEDAPINSAEKAYNYMRHHLEGLGHEEFWVLLLKQNLRPLREVRVSQGGIAATAVDVKIVLREALLAGSPSIMVFHNHPSGGVVPSIPDKDLTKKIVAGANAVDIRVLDHIIIGSSAFYSFHEHGEM